MTTLALPAAFFARIGVIIPYHFPPSPNPDLAGILFLLLLFIACVIIAVAFLMSPDDEDFRKRKKW